MLLRVILTEQDIRRVTIENMPDTVDGLHLILKNKLGLEGVLRVQFQDPMFNNELCNLSDMSDLPKDKATLKVYSQPLEEVQVPTEELHYHTDSTLDTASLSTSPESSPSPVASTSTSSLIQSTPSRRQLPHSFQIPTFSFDTELRLRQGNEAFQKDGSLLDVSKCMTSDILGKLADAIYVYTPYPEPDEYALVAQALIKKHPCLREPGSEAGWYCWKFSLKYKMANFRNKLRDAGCPELKINSRSSTTSGKKTLKRARKSEVNFMPDLAEGKTHRSLEEERTAMLTEMKKRKVDWKQIQAMMTSTFPLRRKEIVEDEPGPTEVRARWPALFSERQIEAEFARLTSVDLKGALFAGLDKYLQRFIDLYRAKTGVVELNKLLKTLDSDCSIHSKRAVVLMGLPLYLKEVASKFYKKVQASDDEKEMTKGMKLGILMVADEADLLGFAVVLDAEVVFQSISDFPTAVALLMGVIYALDIHYPKGIKYTFEVIQKVLMDIGGANCSALVHGLRNRLMKKTM